MSDWICVCTTDEIEEEDLIRWDHGGRTYAIYKTNKGFFATDGLCTHEDEHLENGLVIGTSIECPLHGALFDIPTGKVLSAPACVDLATYPVRIEGEQIFIQF